MYRIFHNLAPGTAVDRDDLGGLLARGDSIGLSDCEAYVKSKTSQFIYVGF